jgi:hypothetical protein
MDESHHRVITESSHTQQHWTPYEQRSKNYLCTESVYCHGWKFLVSNEDTKHTHAACSGTPVSQRAMCNRRRVVIEDGRIKVKLCGILQRARVLVLDAIEKAQYM